MKASFATFYLFFVNGSLYFETNEKGKCLKRHLIWQVWDKGFLYLYKIKYDVLINKYY